MITQGTRIQDFVEQPRVFPVEICGYLHSARCQYDDNLSYGFLRNDSGQSILFHKSNRRSFTIHRIRKTLNLDVRIDGRDHKTPILPWVGRVYYKQEGPRHASEWFLEQDIAEANIELSLVLERHIKIWQSLPRYSVFIEEGSIGNWDSCEASHLIAETNRPSTAHQVWRENSKQISGDRRLIAIIEHPDATDIATTIDELKSHSEKLEPPGDIL